MDNIKLKLQSLREEWKTNPRNRELILRRVRAIQYSQKSYKNKSEAEHEELVGNIIDNLT